MRKLNAIMLILLVGALPGCKSTYYSAMEKLGYHKRDLLVDRVEEARDSQEEAKEQFESALEKFGKVVDFKGGKLAATYEQLNSELEKSEAKGKAVRKRIDSVEDVGKALFAEWESELKQYSSAELRRSSQAKLNETKGRYNKLVAAMNRAEAKIDPVLKPFRDQVLFLKHNLNAQAIASLHDELISVEADIGSLIKEMEASIAEADAFIKQMGK